MSRKGAIVIFAIVMALIGGSFAFVFGGPSSVEESLGEDGSERSPEGAASRGGARTPGLAAIQLTQAAGGELMAPADEPNPTTTTTSTTQPPVGPTTTSTTAAPATSPDSSLTTTAAPAQAQPKPSSGGSSSESGKASYYKHKPGGCAHKTIPKGTTVNVTNTSTGASATCVVNDRGPFVAGRVIDLDITVYRQIGSTSAGVVPVRISW